MRRCMLAVAVLWLAFGSVATAQEQEPAPGGSDHVSATMLARQGQQVPDSYIVEIAEPTDVPEIVDELAASGLLDGDPQLQSGGWFAGELTAAAVGELEADARVTSVTPDVVMTVASEQHSPPLGLDRVDQRGRPLDQRFHYSRTGQGVRAYVVDTGIRTDHDDLGGRTATGYSALPGGTSDCNGHGTHVAGTIGGDRYGVAKGSTLVPVRVLDCAGLGTAAGIVAGLDWIVAHHPQGAPGVVNVSLGGPQLPFLDAAVDRVIDAGLTVVAAAGNEDADACLMSPARVPRALTVAASDPVTDTEPYWSNSGSCVDLYAPGVGIVSAWHTSSTASARLDGTSMAAPHVAGIVAGYLQADPAASPGDIHSRMIADSTPGVIQEAKSPNRLAFAALDSTGSPATPTDFTCAGLPPAPFTDVAGSNERQAIECVHHWGIARGATPTLYRPTATVTRAQMASFLVRSLELLVDPAGSLPARAQARFPDVSGGSAHAADINRLAAVGIVQGKLDGSYQPSEQVTRAEMAIFLARSHSFATGRTPAGDDAGFTDIRRHPHELAINQIATLGITNGYLDGTYRPGLGVRREHMAAFLTRLLHASGLKVLKVAAP